MPRLLNPDDWVRKEITLALDAGNIVIPVFLNEAGMPSKGWLGNCQLDRLYAKQGEKIRSVEYANDLPKLIAVLRKQCPQLPPRPDGGGKRLPSPPDLYAVPNYILTSTFIGRTTELDELDAWACSHDPLLVVEGIGGLGKSALTWEWTINRAAKILPDLARKELSHYERRQELLTELKRRPFLLVLDGFERVLTAYRRWDKAQQRDDKIEANLRECADPRDGELLQQLLHGSPSKSAPPSRN